MRQARRVRARSALSLLPFALGAFTGACVSSAATTGTSPPAPASAVTKSAPDAAPARDDRDAAAELEIPIGKPGWKSVPKEQNGFYVALDGLCSKLGFGRAGKDVVVHYGGTSMYATDRSGNASFIGLREAGLESIGDPVIASPTGVAGKSLEDFWIADSTGSRSSEGAILHRRSGTAWKTYPKDQTNLHAWLDGGVIGQGGMALANGELWTEGSNTKPPAALENGLGRPTFAAFPTGDILLVAQPADNPDAPYVSRTWSPRSGVKQQSLAMLGIVSWPLLVEVAPNEVYATMVDKVARWDGSKWKLLGTTSGPIRSAHRAADDDLWVILESGGIQRSTPKGFVTVPTPEPLAGLSGVDFGTPWAVGQSGKLYKRENDAWKEAKFAAPAFTANSSPAFKAKQVLVVAPDDVLVIALYWEKGVGWKEPELHQALLRSKPVKETLRCNEPDPENNNVDIGRGFQSWPPTLTSKTGPSCSTPFAVLARRSNAIKSPPGDWPKIRAALKGHADLGEVSLVEFKSGDRTFVGAKAKDYDTARKMAELAAGKDRLRPEIVCGEPPVVDRTLALDSKTGDAAR